MRAMKLYIAVSSFLLTNLQSFSQTTSSQNKDDTTNGLLVTSSIAVVGYLAKSFYDLYMDRRKKRIQNIEEKLKLFYWPVLIRLEKDNCIWETILSKRKDPNSIQYKIASQVEKNSILKNHQEILEIIGNYAYIAEPNTKFTEEIKKYIEHVTIYKALRESGEETVFPEEILKPYPQGFYPIIKQKTEEYQSKLNKRPI